MALKQAYILIGNSSSDRQPVKKSECWRDVNMWKCTDYKTGCTGHILPGAPQFYVDRVSKSLTGVVIIFALICLAR